MLRKKAKHLFELNCLHISVSLSILVLLTVIYLLFTPDIWLFSNDDAIYLGSAENLLHSGQFSFNQRPNLLVYPGTSLVLALILSVFGKQFYAAHLTFVLIGVAVPWLTWLLFRKYSPLTAIVTAILLALNPVFMSYVYTLRSDLLFLAITLLTLLLWQHHLAKPKTLNLLIILLLVSSAPLVRFQGLFLSGTFILAYGWATYRSKNQKWLAKTIAVGLVSLLPFMLWTWRDYSLYTPDNYNMVLNFFFGLSGPAAYSGEVHAAALDHPWQYPLLRLLALARAFSSSAILPAWATGTSLNSALLIFIFFCWFSYVGFKTWWRRASLLEKTYLGCSLSFLLINDIYSHGNSSTLISFARYWLPVLPFLLYMCVTGVSLVIRDIALLVAGTDDKRSGHTRLVLVSTVIGLLLLAPPLWSGTAHLLSYNEQSWRDFWEERHAAAREIKEFVNENIAADSVVIGSDWGFIPYLTDRRTITLIDSEALALQRIRDGAAEYLIVFLPTQSGLTPDTVAPAAQPYYTNHPYYGVTQSLLANYPKAFQLQLSPAIDSKHNFIAVYKINHQFMPRPIPEPSS